MNNTQVNTPAAPLVNPPPKNTNIWMVISIILIIILVSIGAYMLGKSKQTSQPNSANQQSSVTEIPASSPTVEVLPTSMVTPTISGKTVNAGGFGSFPKYTISIPQGWQQEKTVNNFQDLLTISKDKYQLQINQTNMGNGGCSYPGVTPEPMSQQYTTFISLAYNGDSHYYRRSKSQIPYPNGEDQYAICQKNSANSYSFVTTFGSILYMAPTTPDQQTLLQMDLMVQSMQKQ